MAEVSAKIRADYNYLILGLIDLLAFSKRMQELTRVIPFVPLLDKMEDGKRDKIVAEWENARLWSQAFDWPIRIIFTQAMTVMSKNPSDPIALLRDLMLPESKRLKDFREMDSLDSLRFVVNQIPIFENILRLFMNKKESNLLRLEALSLVRFREYFNGIYPLSDGTNSGSWPSIPEVESIEGASSQQVVHDDFLPMVLYLIRLDQMRDTEWLKFLKIGVDADAGAESVVTKIPADKLETARSKLDIEAEKKGDLFRYVIGLMVKEPSDPVGILRRTGVDESLAAIHSSSTQIDSGESMLSLFKKFGMGYQIHANRNFHLAMVKVTGELHPNDSQVAEWNEERARRIRSTANVMLDSRKRFQNLI